jgi:hypothetical protein
VPGSIELDPGRTGIDEKLRVDFPSQVSWVQVLSSALDTEPNHASSASGCDSLESRLATKTCGAGAAASRP